MNNKSTIYSEVLEATGMPIDLLILESIATLITFVAIILIVIASIKIFKIGNIPGGKLILGSLLGIVATLINTSLAMYSDEENNIIVGAFEIFLALLLFLGAFGFLKLAKYLDNKKC